MVSMEHTYTCSGCGKEKKGFFMGPFRLHVRDDRKIKEGQVYQYDFCDMKCLKRWARKQST